MVIVDGYIVTTEGSLIYSASRPGASPQCEGAADRTVILYKLYNVNPMPRWDIKNEKKKMSHCGRPADFS